MQQFFLSTFYMPDTVYTVQNKTEKLSTLKEITLKEVQLGKADHKHINQQINEREHFQIQMIALKNNPR